MPEMEGPFYVDAYWAGWATAGVSDRGTVVIVLANDKDDECSRMTFEMNPLLAAALNAALGQAIAMACVNKEVKDA